VKDARQVQSTVNGTYGTLSVLTLRNIPSLLIRVHSYSLLLIELRSSIVVFMIFLFHFFSLILNFVFQD
jgi:hypothetical protein